MPGYRSLSNGLLLLSDRPEDSTGLARAARDIATLAATMPEFRVGYLARGGQGMRKFPFTYYSYPVSDGWGQGYLAGVAKDFFGSERGIVLTNWDISRLGWLAGQGLTGELASQYEARYRNWDLWGYFPVDNVGPDGSRVNVEQRQTLQAFNRVMAASEWGISVLKASGRKDADWLPHGIWTNIFNIDPKPHEKVGWDAEDIHVGFVASNQARKDWPVAFETISHLRKTFGNRLKFWLHTDLPVRYWNAYSLAADYGISDCIDMTTQCTDAELALRYAACDCTILPSGGEGFSYTTAESLACGTAQIVANYSAAQELVDEDCRVNPVTFRVDTMFNVQRAVLSGWGFARAAEAQIEKKRADREYRADELRETVMHLSWDRLKYPWMKWLQQGLRTNG